MEDNRPIVYIARKLEQTEFHEDTKTYNASTLAYFVSKAHLKSKKIIYYKTTKSNSYEYEVDCGEFPARAPVFGYFINVKNWLLPIETNTDFIAKDYKSCKRYVDKKNKELLEENPEITNVEIIEKAQKLGLSNITEEEMLGIEEEKGQE